VARLALRGMTSHEIARRLKCGSATVKRCQATLEYQQRRATLLAESLQVFDDKVHVCKDHGLDSLDELLQRPHVPSVRLGALGIWARQFPLSPDRLEITSTSRVSVDPPIILDVTDEERDVVDRHQRGVLPLDQRPKLIPIMQRLAAQRQRMLPARTDTRERYKRTRRYTPLNGTNGD
jgi:hypothetical protein